MGRERFSRLLARIAAVTGLAAVSTFAVAGPASASLKERAGDEVVLKGNKVSGLYGTAPDRVVAFRYDNRWVQVPVQVDERHTIDARQLYPAGTHPPYVGGDDPAFDIEVYADPKTRSGADANPSLDSDDEVVFMAGDAGAQAPKGIGAPLETVPSSALRLKVADNQGNSGFVYLFKSTGHLEQSAGKDYVDYDFKLTGLGSGQTLINDYGYFSEFNPEDSTVTTKNYQLHSFDRWMEDQMKIKAGNANGTDILDREVAQATRVMCGRSEYTFSGRWQQDTFPGNDTNDDNEGTYVTVIDGPVRAIRSFMGANSGPYVQREHIYYADHERNTVYLRVHPMLDLYTWTDFAPSANGMIYRDLNNQAGVTVDGNPDTLTPTTSADISNGAYGWQQLSGPQGTATTVVGADTDIPNANFGNYYLDDSTPTAPNELQCGGDGQSIGASGFGILGPTTPNTDPRSQPFNNLTVKRIRYFGPPSDGVAAAEDYTARVSDPLAGSAKAAPMKKAAAGLKVKLLNTGTSARAGHKVKLRLRLTNSGNLPVSSAKVCVKSGKLVRRTCAKTGKLGIGKSRKLTLAPKVKASAGGNRIRLSFSYGGKAGNFSFAGGSGGGPSIGLRR